MREVVLTAADANRRLDKYLSQYLNNAPRSFLYKMLRKKRIKLNGKRADGNEITAEGDRVLLYLSPETLDEFMKERTAPITSALPCVVYEDEYILLLNKPAGLLTHTGNRDTTDTLITRALYYLMQTGAYDNSRYATFTPALCNRLDRNTSGLVICGKTLAAVQAFNFLFAERGINKEYLAVVHGKLLGQGVLNGYLRKDGNRNTVCIVSSKEQPDDLPVTTFYKAIKQAAPYTLLHVKPITGRSHQIRAHLASIGHPLAGDAKYGGKITPYAPAQLLHCMRLTLASEAVGLPYKAGQRWQTAPSDGFLHCLRDWFNISEDVTDII